MNILVRSFKRYDKNTLKAFVDLEILDIGLTIKDCTVHQQAGSSWIGLPGRQYEDEGKKVWATILIFSKEKKEEFRIASVEAIKEFVINEKKKEERPDDQPKEYNPF